MNLDTILIGQSPALKRFRKDIPQLGKRQSHLLLKGDAGTGKGTIAQLIFEYSGSKGKLCTLNPATSTELEIEDVLTTPNSNVGMYLIREIEEFSFLYQTRIQRFIEKLPKRSSTHVVVTTKKTLADSRKDHKLIDELFNVLKSFDTISVPSLNQRPEDIPLLVDYFIKSGCEKLGVRMKAIDINTLDFLVRREWKENVRELKRVMEKAIFMSQSDTFELPESLIDEYAQLDGIIENIKIKQAFSFDKSLYNLEKTLIERTLEIVGFHQGEAARMLNLSEANLRYRMKKFHIPTIGDK
jgi:DNA-binding NtrC family response regulator